MIHNYIDIANCINENDNIVILTHTNMDGDAMGSSAALCTFLIKMGKKAEILIEDDVPGYLSILDRPFFVKELSFVPNLAIAVDLSDSKRIENRISYYENANDTICIDHHISADGFAKHSVIDPDVAATGMLIYELLKHMNAQLIDKEIAENIYVAIATDTGRFKYSNTTAYVHEMVAELYKYGIEHVRLCNAVFDTFPISQIQAEGIAVNNMKLLAGGKGIVSFITLKEMNEIGARYDQIDTCIDRIRLIEGTEVAAFLKEKEEGVIKVSLRAKSYANVNDVAKALGGGGHEKASGATIFGNMEEALKLVQKEIEKEFSRY